MPVSNANRRTERSVICAVSASCLSPPDSICVTERRCLRTATIVAGGCFGGRSKDRSGVELVEPDGVRQRFQAAVCEKLAEAQTRRCQPYFPPSIVAGANYSQSAAVAVSFGLRGSDASTAERSVRAASALVPLGCGLTALRVVCWRGVRLTLRSATRSEVGQFPCRPSIAGTRSVTEMETGRSHDDSGCRFVALF